MNYFLSTILIISSSLALKAQVGIGTTTPHASSILEVESNNKGFLPPRLTHNLRNSIPSPSEGLIVYCTDCCDNGMLSVYNGTKWTYPIDCSQIDLDDDGIPNYSDIDDDNDGIPDQNESTELVLKHVYKYPGRVTIFV